MHQEEPRPIDLVGRDAALGTVGSLLRTVAAGRRGLLLVEGDAGIGKTSFVRTALSDASATAIWATCDEAEAELGHGTIEQLARAAPLRPERRAELEQVIGGDSLHVGAWMVRLLDEVEFESGRILAVVVDDAQWADPESLQALAFAARRLRRDPVLLCLVSRPGGLAGVPRGLRQLIDDEGVRLGLEPLERDAVRRLVVQVTGRELSASAVTRLHEHTGGNPLHVKTLLEELPADVLDGAGDLPSPRAFGSLVLARLAAAGPDVARLVTAAAVLGEPAPLASVVVVAGLRAPAGALDDAVELGLLTSRRDEASKHVLVELPHPLLRAAVLDDLAPERRAELHRRAGEVVPGAAGLRHRLHGALTPDGALWEEAVAVAGGLARAGEHGTAASLLRAAGPVAPSEEAAASTLLETVEQLLHAGRLDDARALRPAVGQTRATPARHYVDGRLAYVLGPRRDARPRLLEAWRALGGTERGTGSEGIAVEDHELAGRVAAMLATASVDRADGEAALRWARAAFELEPHEAARASTAHMLASGWALTGRYEDGLVDLDRRCREVEGRRPADATVADLRSARGLLRLWTHDLVGAADDLTSSLAAYDRAGSFVGRETARAYLAEVRYRQGRFDDAIRLAGLCASIVDDTDQVWMAALPHATAARPCAARGESAAEHIERATAAAAAVGGGVAAGLALVAELEVAACRRDVLRVIEIGDALRSVGRPVDDRIAPWRASFVEALVFDGQLDVAAEVAEDLAADAGTPLLRNGAARAAVAIAAGRDDADRLEAAADAGLREDPEVVGPYPRARLELALGRAWRRRGERRRAVAVLEVALGRFDTLRATPWIAQVEAELVASGLRPRRREEGATQQLTPQEEAVAHLVASGRTNREVAAELIVSAKTVEHHLTRIYAKLGVRSRTQLASRYAAAP